MGIPTRIPGMMQWSIHQYEVEVGRGPTLPITAKMMDLFIVP
jgi:hypothetical protein